jgi:hypothetical protein
MRVSTTLKLVPQLEVMVFPGRKHFGIRAQNRDFSVAEPARFPHKTPTNWIMGWNGFKWAQSIENERILSWFRDTDYRINFHFSVTECVETG